MPAHTHSVKKRRPQSGGRRPRARAAAPGSLRSSRGPAEVQPRSSRSPDLASARAAARGDETRLDVGHHVGRNHLLARTRQWRDGGPDAPALRHARCSGLRGASFSSATSRLHLGFTSAVRKEGQPCSSVSALKAARERLSGARNSGSPQTES